MFQYLMAVLLICTTHLWAGIDEELIGAAKNNNLTGVISTLQRGANPNIRDTQDSEGKTALIYAAIKGNLPMVQELLKKNADATITTTTKKSAVDLASSSTVSRWLQDKLGGDVLFLASQGNFGPQQLDFIKRASEVGANINYQESTTGWTALHYAANTGSQDAIKLLRSFGARPNIPDKNGKTPLDVAKKEVIELLK